MASGVIKKIDAGLLTEEYVVADGFNINAGNIVEKSLNISKPGYMPIGIVGQRIFNGTAGTGRGSSYVLFHTLYLLNAQNGSATIDTFLRNVYTVNATGLAASVFVLWQKVD